MLNARKWLRQDISEEFAEAQLGDARRTARVQRLARAAAELPGAGFPKMVKSDSELEGVYRFLRNEAVKASDVLEPHIAETMKRAGQAPLCLIIHDTTEFEFKGDAREGLGFTNSKQQGFYGHFALAVLPGEARVPLGVCGLEHFKRTKRKGELRKPHSYYTAQDPNRESLRWFRMLDAVEDRREGFECIHIMDREGDIYDLMAAAIDRGARFIIRGDKERALANDAGYLQDVLKQIEPRAYRKVDISPRFATKRHHTIPKRRKITRKARTAKLAIGSTTVELRRPKTGHSPLKSIKVNVVYVWEKRPPRGEDPIDWLLVTTEPVETKKQLLAVVDNYRARWSVEDLFKALKTGCGFEKRQLESYRALTNALAVFSVVAWRLLLARSLARTEPNARATSAFTPVQLKILQHRLKLPTSLATARQALLALAQLGGHIKNNGDPGWLTLGRGFEELLVLEAGFHIAQKILLKDAINL
jgi:hypothetical protein